MMRFRTFTVATAVGLTAMATAAGAATMTLDDFDTDIASGPVSSFDNIPATIEDSAPSAIGNFREITVVGDSGVPDAARAAVDDGELTFSNDAGVQGRVDVIYDGEGDSGLGGVDLTMGGTDGFFAFDLTTDVSIGYQVSVMDTFGDSGSSPLTASGSFVSDETVLISFAEFAGVDLTSADSVTLSLVDTSTDFAADVTVDNFRTTSAIPLPASALLMLGGLGAFGFARKRRG
ncbi:hypothetical protein OB2597_09374 [Pseudooceanicola batsensis HTCC2597]|uniref:PEP-CTERM protein-sorting domain-containing protein n=1 Tax=Pseudooceanicola batsensis (strain ATCC BAA-863 / DSM 15984 / KCTC 12145 / HTCC2597) TaxID=252305 RepID=A3TUZ7_PSEBH|nr:VPLPA-CTERM sorting domain-containing protein [Pseudooceanicola batsensis]EAQ04343.1 hypothetical protein OB2597_09374 [Pseudooceanicola batsensis HTCC2597]